ncbi:MAG: helix-turn-helix domain-containing protein [Gammaproteobacteria bacterium]|jgi:AraC-like DNA-binding protein|nr:helix-turn-helix domain-containing protein [Gammaproteobacteria bacterium]
MVSRDVLNWLENDSLTQEDIIYLLDRLCRLGTKFESNVSPKVVIFLKSKTRLDNVNREDVAKYLNMSSRTLSRKLKKEETGFQKILDEERQRRCFYCMDCNIVCGQEIVELLGLSDISHFYRTFKQWTGYSFSEAKSLLAENHSEIDTIFHRHNVEINR